MFVEHAGLDAVVEAAGGIWGLLRRGANGVNVQAVVSARPHADPAAVGAALRAWGLPAYTTDPAVAEGLPSVPGCVFGMSVDGAGAAPAWPERWTLHAMDRA